MADLPDVAIGQPHVPAHNAERQRINELEQRTRAKFLMDNDLFKAGTGYYFFYGEALNKGNLGDIMFLDGDIKPIMLTSINTGYYGAQMAIGIDAFNPDLPAAAVRYCLIETWTDWVSLIDQGGRP